MYINALITSATGKVAVIAYRHDENALPRVHEVRTPKSLVQWQLEPWIHTLELRAAMQHRRWSLGRQSY